jgi:hypothetical protein
VYPLQRFVAELSNSIDKADFEAAWNSDPAISGEPKAEFTFTGRMVSVPGSFQGFRPVAGRAVLQDV